MVDPIGAPTLAQMFSPTKSPFHALSLVALTCLAAIFKDPLADYGTGLMLTVIAGSFCLGPFFRPRYSDQTYGLSLMFGRAAGLIGAMIALAVLISKSSPSIGPGTAGLNPATEIFRLLWLGIIIQSIAMGALFLCKTNARSVDCTRFNILQFSLMQSTLLIFIVLLAAEAPDFSANTVADMISDGGATLIGAPAQIFSHAIVRPSSITLALMLLWCISGAVNLLCMLACVTPGWIGDHGEGAHS